MSVPDPPGPANDPTKLKPVIPNFTGEDGKYDVEMFVACVHDQSKLFNWTDAQTAAAAMGAIWQGRAWTWKLNLQKQKPASYASWGSLKPLLEKRFGKARSANSKSKLVAGLKQKSSECVADFYDRVVYGCDACINLSEDLNKGETRGFGLCQDQWKKILFLNGLNDIVRPQVEIRCAVDEASAEVTVQVAIEIETALAAKPVAAAAASASPAVASIDAMQRQIDQLKLEKKNNWQKKRDGQQSGGQNWPRRDNKQQQPDTRRQDNRGDRGDRGGRRETGNRGGDRRDDRRGNAGEKRKFCTRCRQFGFHGADSCPRSLQEISALAPQDPQNAPPPSYDQAGVQGFYRAVDGAVGAQGNA